MATTTRILSNVAGVLLSLSLGSLCACAPESAGVIDDDHDAPVASADPPPSATESNASPPAAEPPAPPAPPKVTTPIPLYTLSGTFVPAKAGYQADIAMKVDPKLYEWVPVDYPATLLPLNDSINQGVASLIAQIKSRPGKFALVGYSQGGAIISRVYDELRSGSLQDRRQDLIAGVAMGNPMREGGHTIPGGTDPGGHGLFAQRLVNAEALWWDFCNPGDLACSVGDDPVGRDYTLLSDILLFRWNGRQDPVQLVISVLSTIMNPLQVLTQIGAIAPAVQGLISWGVPGLPNGNGAHGAYPVSKPIPNDPRTSIELAVDYLNQTAAAQ